MRITRFQAVNNVRDLIATLLAYWVPVMSTFWKMMQTLSRSEAVPRGGAVLGNSEMNVFESLMNVHFFSVEIVSYNDDNGERS